MRFSEEDALVNVFLNQGKYIIYAKIEHQVKVHPFENEKASLSCYSNKLCRFKLL